MTDDLLIYLIARNRGRAALEVIPSVEDGQEPEVIEVVVDDNEPDEVFGPLIQRAVEEAGYDFYVEDWTQHDKFDGPAFTVKVPSGVTREER